MTWAQITVPLSLLRHLYQAAGAAAADIASRTHRQAAAALPGEHSARSRAPARRADLNVQFPGAISGMRRKRQRD